MKLNKIFMALAAMAVVGCSSDDLNVAAPEQAAEDSRLVELNPNFVLAGVGVEDTGTRTHWEQNATTKALQNKFLPIYNATAAAGDMLDEAAELTEQAVGLCWLGQGAVGTDVYTNYQFYHFGWLNNDETKAEVECNVLQNGATYDEIGGLLAVTNGAGGEAIPGTDWDKTVMPTKALVGKVAGGADNLNYNSGVYKTKNKSIFGGQYIVYYPFNKDFKEAGTIPAKAEPVFNNVSTSFDTPELGKATFRYSAPVTIAGGDQAADFGLQNLSSLVQLRVATPADDAVLAGVATIDQIVLYSAKEQLLKQANLAADKIVAGQKGAGLYASTEGTKTITANFAAAVTLQKTNSTGLLKPTSAYITVLPTTVEDLVVLVHSGSLKKWAKVSLPNTVFEAGKAKRLDITVANADFKSDFIAVDDASLRTALTEANAVATATDPATITVIGDITLAADLLLNAAPYTQRKNIKIAGDDIIVPQDVLFRAETNLESDVRVLGRSCCTGTWGGRFEIYGGTVNNVTMEETEAKVADAADYLKKNPLVTYKGAATVAADKTFDVQAGTVYVNAAVAHKGAITIAEGANLIVNEDGLGNGDLQFMGSTVVNDGTIEVKKDGKFDITDKDGNASATDGKNMTNNGKFIHNVDAGVGTAVQSMKQNGEYRCRVDEQIKLDDAFLQWTACSVIEMVNTGALPYDLGTAAKIEPTAYKHNGKYIDIEVNAGGLTTFYNPTTATIADNKDIQIGNLTVTAGGLFVDFVQVGSATVTGKRTLTVNGNMAVKANTTFNDSKKITITKNLTVENSATLTFEGKKQNEGGLAVTKDIKVSGATFDAGAGTTVTDVDAVGITCANFYLEKGARADFGNRNDGAAKNLVVSGTISNPATCTFNIVAANQVGSSVLAWVSCKKLEVGGAFSAARPRVVE